MDIMALILGELRFLFLFYWLIIKYCLVSNSYDLLEGVMSVIVEKEFNSFKCEQYNKSRETSSQVTLIQDPEFVYQI